MTFCNSNNNTRFTTRYQYDWKNYKKPKDMCSSALSMGYSQTTQDLVKALMDEAKLSVRLQEGVTKCMKDGRSLFCANLQEHNLSRYKRNKNPVIRTPKDCLRNTISCGLRSRKSIEESGAYEREKFKPSPSLVRPPKEKERFQNLMAYGIEQEPEKNPNSLKLETMKGRANIKEDIFDEVLNEIMERRKFLEDMKQLGHEKYYSDMIQFQISQKIKELEAIDQKRMKELGNIMSKGSL
ncbi:UPF0193 protein EVG1-like isoform X1 [Limulus polyphemus]|uniref:UPF0193 protein EVG1-like isoform X1 n=1 Tax=Limulus polyphemus TaxID=6850 RepID=A0ABM1B1T8_LIMPO|nr:UPF0193 protein EVG1-like isoform X1 [Limulus polyphemus]